MRVTSILQLFLNAPVLVIVRTDHCSYYCEGKVVGLSCHSAEANVPDVALVKYTDKYEKAVRQRNFVIDDIELTGSATSPSAA